jgi:hypothetical protein
MKGILLSLALVLGLSSGIWSASPIAAAKDNIIQYDHGVGG